MPDMPDHTQKRIYYQIAAPMDILLHSKSKLSSSNSFWDIKIFKIIQSDWFRVLSITSQELDFSQPCRFCRFSKVVYYLKPKIHIDGPNLSSKSVLLMFFSEHLGLAWLNPKKITWSNCNFHEHLTTFKNGILYLR